MSIVHHGEKLGKALQKRRTKKITMTWSQSIYDLTTISTIFYVDFKHTVLDFMNCISIYLV